ncbi:MAG: hypothetical protein NTU47_11985 [Ignavibacteriales bacterium]|nr:hypothetical protein [Ignavibacteriales bacterium]
MPGINSENVTYRDRWTVATVFGGFMAGGLPLWPVPYDSLDLTSPGFLGQWMVAGMIAGGLPALFSSLSKYRTACFVAAGFGLSVLARVLVETIQDPTNHNLWPFEFVIGAAVGLVSGFAGSYLVSLVRIK